MNIGIITVGGDCSGLNSIIYGAYKACSSRECKLIGFKSGLRGLIDNETVTLDDNLCTPDMTAKSGSILRTDNRYIHSLIDNGFTVEQLYAKMHQTYVANNLDGLIYIGGDGSICILQHLLSRYAQDLRIVAIPKTIDNDIAITDFSIGFKTAVKTIVDSIECVRCTVESHERVAVIEVMGRDSGYLAMYAGVAAGADIILVPEFDYDMESIVQKIKMCYCDEQKRYCVIVVAEAVKVDGLEHNSNSTKLNENYVHNTYNGIGRALTDKISAYGYDVKNVVVGHIQRGGNTAIDDRIFGLLFGSRSVEMILGNDTNKILCIQNSVICALDLSEQNIANKKFLKRDDDIVVTAKSLGIYCGSL